MCGIQNHNPWQSRPGHSADGQEMTPGDSHVIFVVASSRYELLSLLRLHARLPWIAKTIREVVTPTDSIPNDHPIATLFS